MTFVGDRQLNQLLDLVRKVVRHCTEQKRRKEPCHYLLT